jgi:hypothetical protein
MDPKIMLPPEGKALVYIIRYKKGIFDKLKIICDGKYLGATKARTFLYTIVDPGHHVFHIEKYSVAEVEIDVEAGKLYFIELVWPYGSGSRFYARQIVESDARKYLKKCKLTKHTELIV